MAPVPPVCARRHSAAREAKMNEVTFHQFRFGSIAVFMRLVGKANAPAKPQAGLNWSREAQSGRSIDGRPDNYKSWENCRAAGKRFEVSVLYQFEFCPVIARARPSSKRLSWKEQ